MAGDLRVNRVLLGDSATASQNFILRTNQDGTAALVRASDSSVILSVDALGRVAMPQSVIAFSAAALAATVVPNAAYTKITFGTEEWDTAGCYDPTTSRFTPNVPGYYRVSAAVSLNAVAANVSVAVFKNGVEHRRGQSNNANSFGGSVAAEVLMNGTTDFLEVHAYQASGASVSAVAGGVTNYFQASLVART